MCGIVGVMSEKLSLGDYLKFKDLFTLAQLRGDDGAGIATVPMTTSQKPGVEKIRVRKTTWSSGHLVTTADYDEATKGDVSILLGHARQPTKGASKIENVHPHTFEGVTLVHNGTMTNVDGSSIGANESDSKLICKTISQKGVRHFVDNSSGAYCLVWTDLRNQTINFLRNSQRPLYMMEIKQSQLSSLVTHVWWASELWMLYQALSRLTGVLNKDLVTAYALPINELRTYPLAVEPWIKEPTIEKMEKKYKYDYTTSSYGYYEGWEDWVDQNPKGDTGSKSVVPFQGNSSASSGSSTRSGSGDSKPFVYVPPEHRQKAQDNSSSDTTTAIVSAGRILERSKQDAELNAAAAAAKVKEVVAKATENFRHQDLDKFAATRKHALELISAGACIWCEEKPLVIEGQDLKIYPVRFAVGRKDYACSECIKDMDIQRMVGIG